MERHSAVVGFLWHLATAAGLCTDTDKGVGGAERPGDLLISFWKGAGPLAVDAVIVHFLNPSTPYTSIRTGNEAVTEAEHKKREKHGPACAEARVAFEPFGMSTFGQLGDLVALIHDHGSKEEMEEIYRRCGQQLQLSMKRDIARM